MTVPSCTTIRQLWSDAPTEPSMCRGCGRCVTTGGGSVSYAETSRSRRPGAARDQHVGWQCPDPATEAFVAHRNLLFTVAYEMLGSAADAEDVLQETWLRWVGVDLDTVRDQRAYLVRITTRQALNRLRTLRPPQGVLRRPLAARAAAHRARRGRGRRVGRQRLDGDAAGAGDADADRAGGVRAARGVRRGYDEIAEAVDKSPAAVRQIAHRARAARRGPPAARGGLRRPRPATRSTRSSGRSKPATCRACSTSSRRTSCCWATAAGSSRPCCGPIVGADKVARLLAAGLGRIAGRGVAAAGAGQRLPGADRPARRRDRHRHRGAHRRRPDHRALRRAQSGEAVAHRAGDRPEPLTPAGPAPRPALPLLGRRRGGRGRASARPAGRTG